MNSNNDTIDNVHLLLHVGGDGAHFLMYLLSTYCDGYGKVYDNQTHPLPYNERNDYLYVQSPVEHTSDNSVCETIDENVRAGLPWNKDPRISYTSTTRNKPGLYLQQTHVKPYECTPDAIGSDKIVAIIGSKETYFYIGMLNRTKQSNYVMGENQEQYIITSTHNSVGFTTDTMYMPNGINMHYVQYEKLIFNADINEFKALVDYLGLTYLGDDASVIQEINEYHQRNLDIIKSRCDYEHNDANFKLFSDEFDHEKSEIESDFNFTFANYSDLTNI